MEWAIIPYINTHEANQYTGQIRNKKTGYILKGGKNHNGYKIYKINKKNYAGHRLVYHAFFPNIEMKYVIDHKNTNKQDNRFANLQHMTQAEHVQKTVNDNPNMYNKKYQTEKQISRNIPNADEEWKNIDTLQYKNFNFTGCRVSTHGRIFRPARRTITDGVEAGSGYLRVKIGTKYVYAHILICLAFHGNPSANTIP